MHLRVEYLDPYYDSLLRLDDRRETWHALGVLLFATMAYGGAVFPLEKMDIRVTVTTPDSGLPLLRLYFFIEDGTLNIMRVEPYDEMEP